jgi:hypothetical protein
VTSDRNNIVDYKFSVFGFVWPAGGVEGEFERNPNDYLIKYLGTFSEISNQLFFDPHL